MLILQSIIVFSVLVVGAFSEQCTLHYNPIPENKKQLLSSLAAAGLNNQRFVVAANGFTYTVTVCSEVSQNYPNASATKSSNTDKKNTTVIGRLNDTHIVGGSDWVQLTYGSGDALNTSDHCHSPLSTSIMFLCNRDSYEVEFSLTEDDTTSDCKVAFTLKTVTLCPKRLQGLSKGSVFCVLLLSGSLMYLLMGIAYRRIMAGAQGLEQIPHYHFWRDLGNLQADGCDFVCRKGAGRDEPWNRITSNFNDPADEPLLHP